ncbi:hypothetical protein [Sphingomonas quercus]|uniref:Uncharacterized protein n=1 Tax=Sphingomonas quercus TaxID=2842451 RepID=A0ABS6BLU5_9SPHN|nr:hypothetical protein [Sphingomonas quercus]MBU3079283.1 hypothetical protein [Sphingomonas quercus]
MTDPNTPREPEPSYGPDEEGDVPIDEDAVIDDPASWVHVDPDSKPQ